MGLFEFLKNRIWHQTRTPANQLLALKPVDPKLVSEYLSLGNDPKQKLICKAPFTSMSFNHNGYATACCQNFALGNARFPQNTIRSIWEGETYGQLRKHIAGNDLSFSCDFCKTQLERKNYSNVYARTFDSLPINSNGFPSFMEFALNNTCNLECVMCNGRLSSSIRRNRDHLPKLPSPYNSEFANQLEVFIPYLKKTSFAGGEPFLIEVYYEIWDRMIALKPDLEIILTTNGTILNNRVRELLDKGNFSISVSLETLNHNRYGTIRKNGSLDTVLQNLPYFGEYMAKKNGRLTILACPMIQNWQEMPDLVKWSNANAYELKFNTVIKPFDAALWTLGVDKLKEIISEYNKVEFSQHDSVSKANIQEFTQLKELIRFWIMALPIHVPHADISATSVQKEQLRNVILNSIDEYLGKSVDATNQNDDEVSDRISKAIDLIPDQFISEELCGKIMSLPMNALVTEVQDQSVDTLGHHFAAFTYFALFENPKGK
jgi:molybdenum cofactor biosynthesis enzyme MoaA